MAHQEETMRGKRDPVAVLHQELLASPGGIAGAARLIGRSAGVMHNKFSESMPQYEITVREAMALAHAIGSTGFAEAVCDQFDGTFLPLPPGRPGEDDVLQAYLDIIKQMGDLSREFTEARDDGVISPEEFASLKLRGHRSVAAIMHLLNELEAMVREVPAAASVVPLTAAR